MNLIFIILVSLFVVNCDKSITYDFQPNDPIEVTNPLPVKLNEEMILTTIQDTQILEISVKTGTILVNNVEITSKISILVHTNSTIIITMYPYSTAIVSNIGQSTVHALCNFKENSMLLSQMSLMRDLIYTEIGDIDFAYNQIQKYVNPVWEQFKVECEINQPFSLDLHIVNGGIEINDKEFNEKSYHFEDRFNLTLNSFTELEVVSSIDVNLSPISCKITDESFNKIHSWVKIISNLLHLQLPRETLKFLN